MALVLGRRLEAQGVGSPFQRVELTTGYGDLPRAEAAVREVGAEIAAGGVPPELAPFVCGFAGYGNVSRGAQHVFDLLPHEVIEPSALAALVAAPDPPRDRLFKVVFEERHLVERADGAAFALQDYYDHPERYRSTFAGYAGALTVLVNAIFWTEAYPRLIELPWLAAQPAGALRLRVIGDISCDIEGAVACTVKATTPGVPAYVYDPKDGAVRDGVEGPGVAMMTTDCLPCELPREASESFTAALEPFVAAVAALDPARSFDAAEIPDPIRRATILWRGALTPDYAYLAEHLSP